MYAWMVRNQDVISGLVAGICLMSAGDYFTQGNITYGCLNLFIAATNLLLSGKKIGSDGQSN